MTKELLGCDLVAGSLPRSREFGQMFHDHVNQMRSAACIESQALASDNESTEVQISTNFQSLPSQTPHSESSPQKSAGRRAKMARTHAAQACPITASKRRLLARVEARRLL